MCMDVPCNECTKWPYICRKRRVDNRLYYGRAGCHAITAVNAQQARAHTTKPTAAKAGLKGGSRQVKGCKAFFLSDTHKIWDSNPTAQVVDLSSTGYGVRPCM